MQQRACVELAADVGLVRQQRIVGLNLEVLPSDGHLIHRVIVLTGWQRIRECSVCVIAKRARRSVDRKAIIADVTCRVADLEVRREVALDLDRTDMGIGTHDVSQRTALDAVPRIARHRDRRRRLTVAVIALACQRTS